MARSKSRDQTSTQPIRRRTNQRQGSARVLFRRKVRAQAWHLGHRPMGQEARRHAISGNAHEEKPVVPPLVYDFPGDAISRQLDSMTLEDYFCRTYGISRDTVRLMDA